MREHRARVRLLEFGRANPGLWLYAEAAHRDSVAAGLPRSIYAGGEFVGRELASYAAGLDQMPRLAQLASENPGALAAHIDWMRILGAWRMTQGVYRIDPGVYPSLVGTPLDGPIPAHALDRLPEWCLYIETPDIVMDDGAALHGGWVCLDRAGDGPMLWTVALDCDGANRSEVMTIALRGTIDEALREALRPEERADTEVVRGWSAVVRMMLNLSLYIGWCNDLSGTHGTPGNPEPKKTKRGTRTFAVDGVRQWDVGQRMGGAIRAAQTLAEAERRDGRHVEGLRGRMPPHVRRTHWHSFWMGTGSARRLDVRWMPPIPVNVANPDWLPAVVRAVQ